MTMNKTRAKKVPSPPAGQPPQSAAPKTTHRKRREPDWVAWSNDGSTQLATAETLEAAREAAQALGEPDPLLEPVQLRARRI